MASEQPRTSTDSNSAGTATAPGDGDAPKSSEDGGSAGTSPQNSAFQAAISAWRNIDLTHLQKSLDSTAGDIVNGQRESLVERKELAQKTKEYRKLDDEQKKEEWKGLLKSYQIFIDHLTTSKKATETAFLSLYSTLSEAPDPYPLLEATIDSLVNFSDMQAMTKDNASLKATVNRLSNQITNLEASLNAKNKELERKEKEKEEEAQRVEEVWRGVLDEKTRNWEGKEKALTEKLEHQETVLKEIKASYEVARRMGPTSPGAEDDLLGKERAAELEIVTRDLERTTLRLAEVEGRNEQLRLELEKASNQETTGQAPAAAVEDESTILRLQHESANLLRKVNNAKAELDAQKKESERKTRTLERMIDGLEKDKEALRHKVAKCSDYEDVKRELEILKSIEFSTGDDDEDVLDFSSPAGSAPQANSTPDRGETLEQLLLARNKKLGNELTVLRVSHQDLTTRLQTLQQTLDSATAELNTSRALNARLEDDLLKLQQESHNPHSSALSVAGTYVSRYQRSSIAGGSRPSPTSSIIGSHLDSQAPIPSSSNNNAGILPMITAQRDRFKAKNAELEQSLSAAQTTIANLRDEVASLQKDNLQLYEKTRYVSSYTAAASSGFAAANNNNHHGGIDRYRQAYEANISPFEAFRGRESARAYHRMRVPERIIYSFTRVILANRVSRNLFAAYCVLLHLLVGTMLYWSATGAVEGSIGMAATAAAAVAAGGGGPGGGGGGGGSAWKQEGFDGRL